MNALYEALLTRELDKAQELVVQECRESGPESTRDSIMRFAVLAFSPSLHSRGAMYASLAMADLFDRFERPSSLLVECARYVGESRVPWSEAPVSDPPRIPDDQSIEDTTIDEAVAAQDLHAAERWLAAAIESETLALRFFDAASRHAGDEGYGFTTAVTSWRIAERFPDTARFTVLRTAVLEWLKARHMPDPSGIAGEAAVAAAMRDYVRSGGQPNRFPPLMMLDASRIAEVLVSRPGRYTALFQRYVSADVSGGRKLPDRRWSNEDLVYRYAADYGFFIQSVPLSERLADIPADDESSERIPDAAFRFLMSSEGFEEWSFA
ncbi:MAG: hypothetical protein ACSLFM_14755 [Tepidiformaceae bacterium]